MINNVWTHIRNKENELGRDHLPWEDIDDPQEYYHWLCDDNFGTNRIDGATSF